MGFVNKGLVKVCGKPMAMHVVENVSRICSFVLIAVSSNTRSLAQLFRGSLGIDIVETSGRDYVEDLSMLLKALRKPVLVLPIDVPTLKHEDLSKFVDEALRDPRPIATMVSGGRLIGVSLFKDVEGPWIDIEVPNLVDVDTFEDLKLVEEMLCGDERDEVPRR